MEENPGKNDAKAIMQAQLGTLSIFPEEILLHILYLAATDIKVYENIRETSQTLNDFVSDEMTRKVITIDKSVPVDVIIETFNYYYDTIISVIIVNQTGINEVKRTLSHCKKLKNLERLIINSFSLELDESLSEQIKKAVIACPKINILKLTKVVMRYGDNNWRSIIDVIGNRHLKNLSYGISCIDGYAVEKVCRMSRNTLQILKVVIDSKHVPIRDIGNCLELKKLQLEVRWDSYDLKYSVNDLFQLEKLVKIWITVDCVMPNELAEFFTRSCCGLIKEIKLMMQTYKAGYTSILNAIPTTCESLRVFDLKPAILYTRNMEHFVPLRTVLNLLSRCKQLYKVSISPMKLDDILELDKIINTHYSWVKFFYVTSVVNNDYLDEQYNQIRGIHDAHNEHDAYEFHLSAQLVNFTVNHLMGDEVSRCYLFCYLGD